MNGFKSALVATAMVAATAAAQAAPAVFLDFTVDETSVPGANVIGGANSNLVVDKLNGAYDEMLTITGPNTFSAQAYGEFSAFLKDDGTTAVASLLNNLEAFGGYKIYAVFSSSGIITGANSFVSNTNSFSLYLDVSSDTTHTLTDGLTAVGLGNTGDDVLLATAMTSHGTGNLNGPPGAFNIDWVDFTLTNDGKDFFVDPDPFYMLVRVNGDYDGVSLVDGVTSHITGDVSAGFVIPEPTSLALVGLGLLGAGLSRRRKAA